MTNSTFIHGQQSLLSKSSLPNALESLSDIFSSVPILNARLELRFRGGTCELTHWSAPLESQRQVRQRVEEVLSSMMTVDLSPSGHPRDTAKAGSPNWAAPVNDDTLDMVKTVAKLLQISAAQINELLEALFFYQCSCPRTRPWSQP